MSVPFICKCEGKSYAGWFNNKKCKECGTIIYNKNGVAKGGHQWKNQRIKELEAEVESLKDTIKHQKSWIDELYEMAYM